MEKTIVASGQMEEHSFPIVVLGSSAGGLEALEQFFDCVPPNSGMAFVVVSHLSPMHKSLMPQLLESHTAMKVSHIKNGINLQPNSIYIMPPNKGLIFSHGKLQLVARKKSAHLSLPIDVFFHSIAQQDFHPVIAIILSGTGTDGSLGIKAIKEVGGQVIAQTPETAKFDGMPRSAINTGLVDAVLPPELMPAQLVKYTCHDNIDTDKTLEPLARAFQLLQNRTGHNFSLYKHQTILRRIQKRMAIYQFKKISDYTHYLQKNPQEIDCLFKELLIGVTEFFRDPLAFEALRQKLLAKFRRDNPPNSSVRVWVPGCSRGEEAYSIAILLQECMAELKYPLKVQIFATDIDEAAISKARAGIYPATITANVSPARLQQFFIKGKNSYAINKNIRKMVIFACQNVTKDPPFTKLDLLSCRNVLIYIDSPLQKKIIPLFHYSLKPAGILFLGTAESIGGFADLFNITDKKWKIFQRKDSILSRQTIITFPIILPEVGVTKTEIEEKTMLHKELDVSQLAEKFLLDNYGPPCVIINKVGDILYFGGKTSQFLEPAPGKARFNILEMVRSSLKMEMVSALHQATLQHKEIIVSNVVVGELDTTTIINLRVEPLLGTATNLELLAVVFEPIHLTDVISTEDKKLKPIGKWSREVAKLKEKLNEAKESLQISIEEHKSSTEELQSTNEELQSTNEEIETSKEELQSLNEELVTVNAELQDRIDQLSSTNSDMRNLLDSTAIATLFVDNNLCIKRFTPKVVDLINLIPIDVGRPLGHFVSNLDYDTLIEDAENVLKTLVPKSIDVKSKSGYWYGVHIIPYRTVTNEVDGVVLTFLDINAQKKAEEAFLILLSLMFNSNIKKDI